LNHRVLCRAHILSGNLLIGRYVKFLQVGRASRSPRTVWWSPLGFAAVHPVKWQ